MVVPSIRGKFNGRDARARFGMVGADHSCGVCLGHFVITLGQTPGLSRCSAELRGQTRGRIDHVDS